MDLKRIFRSWMLVILLVFVLLINSIAIVLRNRFERKRTL